MDPEQAQAVAEAALSASRAKEASLARVDPDDLESLIPTKCEECGNSFWLKNGFGQWRGFRIRTAFRKYVCSTECEDKSNDAAIKGRQVESSRSVLGPGEDSA